MTHSIMVLCAAEHSYKHSGNMYLEDVCCCVIHQCNYMVQVGRLLLLQDFALTGRDRVVGAAMTALCLGLLLLDTL